MKTTEWYANADDDEKESLLKQSSQLWESYLILKNGAKDTFGDLLEHLWKQYALGTDQFPKPTTKAADVMGAHKIQKENGKIKMRKITINQKNKIKMKTKIKNSPLEKSGNESNY